MKLGLGVFGLQQWFDGDFAAVVELVREADGRGIFDQVSITDHVVMGEHVEKYPYGPFPAPLDYPWCEPLTFLAAVAGATSRIRLSAGVLISPLRPAVLLAKQLATLDVLSRGRVEIAIGLGWQKEEYDAAGVPWEGRYVRMDEQVKVCRLLWTTAPASFGGATVSFDKIHCYPRPVQARMPIWYGLAPTERNFARIAELGDGWAPMDRDPESLAIHIAALRAAFAARGRDPGEITVRAGLRAVEGANGKPDLDATLATIPALAAAGVTMVEIRPVQWCKGPQDIDRFLDRISQWKDTGR